MSKEEKKEEKKEEDKGKLEEGAKPKEEELPKEVQLMKKGDYSVHVLIEEVKNCAPFEGKDQLPFPVVKVTCLGKTKRTEKPSIGCSDLVIGDHFYFDKTDLTTEMLDSEKIVVECYDNKHTKKEDYYGVYEFDFEYIYNRPYHALKNFWIALANPEGKSISEVRGYLKLSISVLHEADPRVELEMSEAAGTDCIIPSQIKMKYKQISIYIFKGEELPDMDSLFFDKAVNRECDGFVEVKYLGLTKKTSVVPMKNEVIQWNEIVDIPVSEPALSQKIVMTIKDKDKTGDDLVGSIEIKINDIKEGVYNDYRYVDIYGAPLNKSGKLFNLMNNNSEIGSKWKGRILLRIDYADVDTPVSRVRPINDQELIEKIAKMGRPNQWTIHYKLYSSYYLPKSGEKYGIRITLQDKYSFQPPREAKDRNIEWNVTDSIQCNTLTDVKEEVSDLFIYLTNEKKDNICFQRIKASEFYLNSNIMVIKMIPDPCIGKLDSMMKSGIIKIKLCMIHQMKDKGFDVKNLFKSKPSEVQQPIASINEQAPVQQPPPEEEEEDEDDLEVLVKKETIKPQVVAPIKEAEKPKPKGYTVVACVYMSRYLIAGDSDGTSDPYVILTLGGIDNKTSIKSNTVNGIWNELLTFRDVDFDYQDQSSWPIFLLNVMDHNTILAETPLGYNYVWLSNASYSFNETAIVTPKWHKLFLPKSNKSQGQIMMSFFIFDEEHKHLASSITYLPETTPYVCEINILGLRRLKALGLFAVKKPYIKFDLNSLNVTGKEEDALQSLQTIPSDTGENPTINSIIKFDAKLPEREIFIPDLQCEVYDHLLSGVVNSLLGVFMLHTKKIIQDTHRQIDEDMAQTKKKFGTFLNEGMIRSKFLPMGGKTFQMASTIKKPVEEVKIPRDEEIKIDTKVGISDSLSKSKGEKEEISIEVSNLEPSEEDKATGIKQSPSFELTNQLLFDNKDNSKFFIIYPTYKRFVIPGHSKLKDGNQAQGQDQPQENAENLQQVPQDGQEVEIAIEKVQKDFIIEDEEKAPDNNLYFKIGYIIKAMEDLPNPKDTTKHYRRIYRLPLEKAKELKLKSPFLKSDLKRGKYEDKENETGLFDAMSNINGKIIKRYIGGEDDHRDSIVSFASSAQSQLEAVNPDDKYYGKFKGLIRICEKKKMNDYTKCIDNCKGNNGEFLKDFKNMNNYENLRKKLLARRSVVIRVYVLELNNLAKKDIGSESDPYIKLICGNTVINEAKNHQDDQKNCKWYKHYDISAEIPGNSTLTLEAWDYDILLSDDLIGSTVIDLEDRYFDSQWQDLVEKPIEVRPLLHPDITGSQGEVIMWLEILDKAERNESVPWKIDPEPDTNLEVRFVVWETENMECMDVEGTSDIYVIGYLDQDKRQTTDTHFRCQTGVGSFNWRLLLPCVCPKTPQMLTLQVYDNDLFSADDYICGTTLNLKNLLTIPKLLELPIKFTRDYYNGLSKEEKVLYGAIEFEPKADDAEGIKFWVQCYKNGKMGGRVLCSLEILPQRLAELNQVGKGREEPNLDPYLPPPVGRFEWSLNPFKMFNQCVGPKFRRKLYCFCCMFLLVIFLSCLIPYLILYISGEVVNPFNW